MEDPFPPLPDTTPVWEAFRQWYAPAGPRDLSAGERAVEDALHGLLLSYVTTDRLTRHTSASEDAALFAWLVADTERRTGEDLRADIRSAMAADGAALAAITTAAPGVPA